MILAGPADDAAPFSKFQVFRNAPLSALKSLMSGAELFIGNDSGPAHIAAAFGVPVVVLFGPSDPVTWAPWRTEARVLTSRGSIDQIAVDEVMAAAEALRTEREGASMRELGRLLRFSRPYTPHLVFSVVLMACVGAAQALTALLIGPIFDRVLNPASAEAPVLLFTIPILHHKVYLSDLMPRVDPQRVDHGGDGDPGRVLHQGPVRLLRATT